MTIKRRTRPNEQVIVPTRFLVLTFLCVQLYSVIKNAGGIPLVDEFFKADSEDLLGKDGKNELINEIKENVSFAYDDFINKVTAVNFVRV